MPASKRRRKQLRNKPPRTAEEFFALSAWQQNRWIRKAHAVTDMRNLKLSRAQAAKKYGLRPESLPRSALRQRANGRYVARGSDNLLRVINLPSEQGIVEVATRDSRLASELARYSEAVHEYLETGDASALEQFAGKSILDMNGRQISLLTDPAKLDRFGGPELSYESFYARSA